MGRLRGPSCGPQATHSRLCPASVSEAVCVSVVTMFESVLACCVDYLDHELRPGLLQEVSGYGEGSGEGNLKHRQVQAKIVLRVGIGQENIH